MADRHDVERALSRGSLAQQVALEPFSSMSDQEIRARALECAVQIYYQPAEDAIERAKDFEAYIRDGVT